MMSSPTQRPPTLFESQVYAALKKIPHGKVTTYQLLANHIGCNSSRAVGQALKRNPYAPEVPCHRVIRSDYTIGGFSGKITGKKILLKLERLRTEGVHFQEGKLLERDRLFDFA